jgi:hypothetical protein
MSVKEPRLLLTGQSREYYVLAAIERDNHWIKQIHWFITTDGKTAITSRQVSAALQRLKKDGVVRFEN